MYVSIRQSLISLYKESILLTERTERKVIVCTILANILMAISYFNHFSFMAISVLRKSIDIVLH